MRAPELAAHLRADHRARGQSGRDERVDAHEGAARVAEGAPGNNAAAAAVGKEIAERAKEHGIEQVAFDRSGFKYHGRVKALADAAREAGLKI